MKKVFKYILEMMTDDFAGLDFTKRLTEEELQRIEKLTHELYVFYDTFINYIASYDDSTRQFLTKKEFDELKLELGEWVALTYDDIYLKRCELKEKKEKEVRKNDN